MKTVTELKISSKRIIGVLDFEKTRLLIKYGPKDYMDYCKESFLEIQGDGCFMPYLNRQQVNTLLASIVAWLNMDDEQGGSDE